MKKFFVSMMLASLFSSPVLADPTLKAGFACFDRESYIEMMAAVQEKDVNTLKRLTPDKCLSADTINTFRFDVLDQGQAYAVIGVRFPHNSSVRLYVYPGWIVK